MKKSKEEILSHLKNTAIGYTELASGEIFGYLYGKEVIDIDDNIAINGGLGTFAHFMAWLDGDKPENMALEDYDMIISIADNLCKLAEKLDSDEEIDQIVSQIDFLKELVVNYQK